MHRGHPRVRDRAGPGAGRAGLLVLECEQPSRKQRRGKGKSDPIDAHLAVLAALRLDAGKLPVPRADGDREALRILLVARQEITEASTAQTGRLRALLLAGDDTDRRAARTTLTQAVLAALAGRDLPAHASREQAVRQAEIRRLALVLGQARRDLKDNRAQLLAIVEDIAPGLTSRFGVGPVSAAQAIVSFSHPGPVPQRSGLRRASRHQPAPGQQRPDRPAPAQPRRGPGPQPGHPCHRAGSGCAVARARGPTLPGAPPRERPAGKSAAASSAISPASSTGSSPTR